VGSGLDDVIEKDPANLDLLKDMWQTWPFFRAILDNAQLEMARSRLETAGMYNRIHPSELHVKIVGEFEKAKRRILEITGGKEFLDNHPVIGKVIGLRNPYTDVLNLAQIELLRRWVKADEKDRGPIRHALFLSINGIAAAMQSTG
jgi:phosphoenolpyruvate carboxylase